MTSFPPSLVYGDKVAMIPPAKAIDSAYVNHAARLLEGWGLEVIFSGNIKSRHHQFAGNDIVRLNAFQKLLDDQSIKAVFCARGGYGTTRIIDQLNFNAFRDHPKWIIGFSDITVILNVLYNLGFSGIHGPMPLNFNEKYSDESLKRLHNILFDNKFAPIHIDYYELNRQGTGAGEIVGGNLTMITNSLGTPSELPTDNRILFLEEIDEYLYRIDRMLIQLKRAGKLADLKGLVIGHFTSIQDNEEPFGMNVPEMIMDIVSPYDYPVCFNAPIGHEMPNYSIPVGKTMKLAINKKETTLQLSDD